MHSSRIAVVGAGWTGCHLALELAKDGHNLTLFEKGNQILSGVSGDFGIRLHRGPHYSRSRKTRDTCQTSFWKFMELYPDLVISHDKSIYAHGESDALGQASKVSSSAFRSVCHETEECHEVDPKSVCMEDVTATFDLKEPSVAIGSRLQKAFTRRLDSSSVEVRLTCEISSIVFENGRITLRTSADGAFRFDKVVNATGFQSLIPTAFEKQLPLHAEVYYQVCLGLTYIDNYPSEGPISRIVMDGWFPCLMPMITDEVQPQEKYVATHGTYTIMASCRQPHDAEAILQSLTDTYVDSNVRIPTESEMRRFWPGFNRRFQYTGWKGVVQAKLKTRAEFRSSVTFEHAGIIYVFPGKISNVFDAYDDVKALLMGNECKEREGVRYPICGVFDTSVRELREQPVAGEGNTSNLGPKL